jgi:hypothetical protein
MRGNAIAIIGVAGLLAGCARSVDLDATRAVLMEADRAFNRATAERRVDGWVDFFAEDGSMFRPGGTVTGKAAVRERMAPAFADTSFTLTWDPTEADVGASGTSGRRIRPDHSPVLGERRLRG